MNYTLAILLLICSAVALADTMTTRIDGAIITTGMSIAEVVHRGRKPDRIVVIETWCSRSNAARIHGEDAEVTPTSLFRTTA